MRVGEGSLEKKKMKNEKNCLKIGVEKAMQKTCENHPKSHPKTMPKGSQNLPKNDAKKEFKNGRPDYKLRAPAAPVRGVKATYRQYRQPHKALKTST